MINGAHVMEEGHVMDGYHWNLIIIHDNKSIECNRYDNPIKFTLFQIALQKLIKTNLNEIWNENVIFNFPKYETEIPNEANFCQECGTKNPNEANFRQECGKPMKRQIP